MQQGNTKHAALPSANAVLWSSFWREFGPEDVPQDRCYVPGDGKLAVDAHWARFADRLVDGAQIIDLGCGAGIVGRTLLAYRRDLHVTGVDWADVPAIDITGLSINPWVRMEMLPFADASFDGATSLFGIEYGDIGPIARELARVLKQGAPFSFLIHHYQSEIAREGTTRCNALRAIMSGQVRAAFVGSDTEKLDREVRRLRMQFPGDPTVKLLGSYLQRQVNRTRAERHAIWAKMISEFAPEVALLRELERSVKTPDTLSKWLGPILAMARQTGVTALHRKSGGFIAWCVSGER